MSSGEAAALSEPGSNPADCQPASTGDTAGDITLPGARSWTDLDASVLFEKVLTSSDINPQGRIVVPKANAEKHLPFLEKQSPSEVHATDTFGNPVVFKFRFWINNQSRMYLLEAGGDKPAVKRKRGQAASHGQATLTTDLNNFYFEPLKDGVFRAVPDGQSDDAGRVLKHAGIWTIILNLYGELYQAYFASQAEALEAFNAAGETVS
ncbi:hypothetical protein WJX82_010592 [Trebouxia sp. C0006]